MRKVLTLPIKTALSGTIAQYAKSLPKPHENLIREPIIETRSRLFEPEILPIPPRRKLKKRHVLDERVFDLPARRAGELNRPDKSEQRTNLTFNWDR